MCRMINDIDVSGPYRVFARDIGQFVFSWLDVTSPGDVPPDIAILPVYGMHTEDNVLIIITEVMS